MKKLLLTFAAVIISIYSFAQDFSFSAGPSWGTPFYYRVVTGDGGKKPIIGINVNAEYIFSSDKKILWGIGLGFQNNRIKRTPAFFGQPEEERIPHVEHSNVLYLSSKMVFRNRPASNFMFEPLIGIQINEATPESFDNQSGIGFGFSYVKKINLNENTYLKIEPKISVFNIIPFVSKNLTERMTSLGINFGFGIRK